MRSARIFAVAAALLGGAAAAAPTPGPLTHPVATAPVAARPAYPGDPAMVVEPMALAYRDATTTLYSRAVNRFTASAQAGNETWLGTPVGIKRIDHRAGTVRHYTRQDGLPGDAVVALAAVGGEVWCLVPLPPGPPPPGAAWLQRQSVALCRLDRRANRWETRREVAVPRLVSGRGGYSSSQNPLDAAAIAIGPDLICFSLGGASSETETMLPAWDRRANRWADLPWETGLRADHPFIRIAFLQAHGDDLWLGTSIGLLRYRRRGEGRWQRYLPERSIYAGARSGEGFWLAERGRKAEAFGAEEMTWRLTHFTESAPTLREYPLSAPEQRRPDFSAVAVAVDRDGAVWMAGSSSGGAAFHRLDPPTKTWKQISAAPAGYPAAPWARPPVPPAGSLEEVPDAALIAVASRPLSSSSYRAARLPVEALARRFPSWFCPEDDLPVLRPRSAASPPRVEETNGGVWSIEGPALTYSRSERKEMFPLPPVPVMTPIEAVAAGEKAVFVTTQAGLHVLDSGTGQWKSLPRFEGMRGYGNNLRLVVQDPFLWLGSERGLLRYNPASGLFSQIALSGSRTPGSALLGAGDGGALWQSDGLTARRVTRAGADTAIQEVTPAVPETLKASAGSAGLRALAVTPRARGDILWYAGPAADGRGSIVVGYDTRAETWTAATQLHDNYSGASTTILAAGESVYAASAGSSLDIHRYDPRTGRWTRASLPPLSAPGGANALRLVAVRGEGLWLLDTSRMTLWHWEPTAPVWSAHPCPAGAISIGLPNDAFAARRGDLLFLGTQQGLWRFDLARAEWKPLPIPKQGDSLRVTHLQADARAVWGAGSDGGVFAARFDRTARRWAVFGVEQGLPATGYLRSLVIHGGTAWLSTGTALVRYDAATGRWQDAGSALAGTAPLQFGDIQAEPDALWVALQGYASRADGRTVETSARPPLLARRGAASGTWETFRPETAAAWSASALRVEPDAVWLIADGIYRFDKTARTWQRLAIPLPASGSVNRIERRDDGLWFVGSDSALRWQTPPRGETASAPKAR